MRDIQLLDAKRNLVTRRHQKEFFYKYMPVGTAKAVLENSSLRWREPNQFNDPFDHQISYIFPYTKDELAEELVKEIEELVYEREASFKEETSLSLMVQILRKSKDKIPKQEVLETLEKGVHETSDNLQAYQDKLNTFINQELNKSRVLCVTEDNDNVVMWSHYADEHRGVCIRLHCIDELDNTLLLAKPINYESTFPIFPSVQEHVKYLTGESPFEMSDLVYKIPYYKHEHWSYENEWRVHVPHNEPLNTDGFNDWAENKRVFGAIYFGCRIDLSEASDLLRLVESTYPNMEVYQSKPSTKEFKLEFERVR